MVSQSRPSSSEDGVAVLVELGRPVGDGRLLVELDRGGGQLEGTPSAVSQSCT